jgi:aminoglycoside phosphotransferase (APT) family kinase protein
VELLRQDFLSYFDAIRRSLGAMRDEPLSPKARDEIECIERVLCRFQAERAFVSENLQAAHAAYARLEWEIGRLADDPALRAYAAAIAALRPHAEEGAEAALEARRRVHQSHMPDLASVGSSRREAAEGVFKALVDLEARQVQRIAALREQEASRLRPDSAAGPADAPGFDGGALQAYLREAFPGEPELVVQRLRNMPGGRSKETTYVELAGVRSLPPAVVIRRDRADGLVPSRASDEFAVLEIVARQGGVPVPAPLHCEADPSRFGGSFIVVAAAPGRIEGDYFPEVNSRLSGRESVGLQLARILARLHQIPLIDFAATHLDTGADLMALVSQTIESTLAEARGFDTPSRVQIEAAYRWLNENLAQADDPDPRVIHCDVGLHNMLIRGGEITALLDWELATVASPAREVAKILHLIDYLMPREEFIAEYLRAGGPPGACQPERLKFYAIMNYMVTNQRARLANHLFFTGKQPGIVMGHAGYELCARNVRLLSNMLKTTRFGVGFPATENA